MKQLGFNKHLLFLSLMLSRFQSKTGTMREVVLLQSGNNKEGKRRPKNRHAYIAQVHLKYTCCRLIQQEHNRRQEHNSGKETLFAAVHALSGEPGQATRRKLLKRLCQTV